MRVCALGIISATAGNSVGVAGVAKDSKIMSLVASNGEGLVTDQILAAIDYALRMKRAGVNLRVINASYGAMLDCPAPVADALAELDREGIVFVSSAGNSSNNNDQKTHTPSGCASVNVISVAAINTAGKLADFSNYGATTVDLAAPGTSIFSTIRDARFGNQSGTSMAAPFVSGVVALLLAAEPHLRPADVRARLLSTVKPLSDSNGKMVAPGIVSAVRALTSNSTPPSGPGNPSVPVIPAPCSEYVPDINSDGIAECSETISSHTPARPTLRAKNGKVSVSMPSLVGAVFEVKLQKVGTKN